MTTHRRAIAICADDLGLRRGGHGAALALLAQGRVSALGCMVHGPAWRDAAPALRDATGLADIGLHLDFTEPGGQRRFVRPWPSLLAGAWTHRLDTAALRCETAMQLDLFEQALHRAPDFIDGHRHVHQLPVIRDLLIDELLRRYRDRPPWLRCTLPRAPMRAGLKPLVVAALGGGALVALARRHSVPCNRRLLGVYPFSDDEQRYLGRLRRWLGLARDGDLLVCHPTGDRPSDDPIGRAGNIEFAALSQPAFGRALQEHGVEVVRLSGLLRGAKAIGAH